MGKLADDQVGGRRPGCSNRRMMRVTATVVESALVRRLTSQAIVVLVAVVGLVGFLAAGTRFAQSSSRSGDFMRCSSVEAFSKIGAP